MWIRAIRKPHGFAVQLDGGDAAPVPASSVADLDYAAEELGLHAQPVELRRNHRIDAHRVRFARESEEMPHDQRERDTGTTGVDTPTAIERDRAARDALVLGARLIPVRECGVRARVV